MSAPLRRPGVTLLEILVAIAMVAVVAIPLFTVYRGTRKGVGLSREMLELQGGAMVQLALGRSLVRSGEVRGLTLDEDHVLSSVRDGITQTLTLSRFLGGRLLLVRARAERGKYFYETFQVLSDPYAVFVHADDEVPVGGGS